MATDAQAVINKAIDDLNKRFGVGSIMNFEEGIPDVEFIKSGSIGLDHALGGGYPKGRIIEVIGWESSGKTTLTIHAMAECQRAGGIVAFIDAENSFDPTYATNLGVSLAKDVFLFSQPSNGEEALEICEVLVRTGKIDMVVVDSVAALTPKAEIEGEMGDSKMGLHARLMSQALRKLTGVINKTNTTVFFINQIRQKIGIVWGSDETTTGGNALKFYASQRIEIKKVTSNKDGDTVVSNRVRVKVIKNKVSPPFRQAEFNIIFGSGIDLIEELVTIAVDLGIIKKSGSWYSYGEVKLGQGNEGVKRIMMDNPELTDEIETIIRTKYK